MSFAEHAALLYKKQSTVTDALPFLVVSYIGCNILNPLNIISNPNLPLGAPKRNRLLRRYRPFQFLLWVYHIFYPYSSPHT